MARKLARGHSPPDHPPELILSLTDPHLRCDLACRPALGLGPLLRVFGLYCRRLASDLGNGMGHLPYRSA